MMSLNQSVGINAPTDVVFAYVTEPATMAEWIPPMVQTRDIVGSGEGQQFEWTYKLAGLLFRAISSTWAFRVGSHDGGAKFTVDIAYDVPVPVLGKLAEHVLVSRDARNLDLALANVKEILEA
jgi:ligand-binding SRPBCC domain-containing protein